MNQEQEFVPTWVKKILYQEDQKTLTSRIKILFHWFFFLTAYAFYTGRFASYAVFSIMYFLTLEVSMQHFHLPNYETLIFDFKFLAALTAFVLADLSYKLYKCYRAVPDAAAPVT